MRRLLLFTALALTTATASAQAPIAQAPAAPTLGLRALPAPTDTTKPSVELRPRLAPTALYSPSRGFGIAGGLGVRHLGWEGSLIEVGGRLSQRFQALEASLYTGDPYVTPLYGLLSGRIRSSERQRFYGFGPTTDRDDRLNLDYAGGLAEVRVGWYPLGHSGLLLQPGARLLWDRTRSFEESESSPGALERFDPEAIRRLETVVGTDRYGVSLGIEVSADTRNRLLQTRDGLLAEASVRRFFALDGSGLGFNEGQLRLFGFRRLRGVRTVLIGRAVLAAVRADGDAELPFFYLPVLDDALLPGYTAERFFGRDLLAAGAGFRFPLLDLFGRYGMDGLVMVDVGSSYDSLIDEFSPRISFDEDVTADENGRVPLRPSLALGYSLINLDRDRAVAGLFVGFSPEGFVISSLRVVYDFRDLRPLFR